MPSHGQLIRGAIACFSIFVGCEEAVISDGKAPPSGHPSVTPESGYGGETLQPGGAGGVTDPPVGGNSTAGVASSPDASGGANGGDPQGGAGGVPIPPRGDRPNIVFILTDDLSWNLVDYMPHVKELQQQGVTFSNYFVTDSLCCPSRASIFTGKFPHNTGVYANLGTDGGYATYLAKKNDPQTFAAALQTVGYRSALLGKFLNGYQPKLHQAAQGWTKWAVAGYGYNGFNYDLNIDGSVVHYGTTASDYLTDVLSGIAQDFVVEPSDQPFMIEIAPFVPHLPSTPAPRHSQLYPGLTYPKTPAFNLLSQASDPHWLRALTALTDGEIAAVDRAFRKRVLSILAVDEMLANLRAKLAASGHDKDTYIVFSSDNGYHMGERAQPPGKQTAFDTDIHVPLIVTGPGIPAGVTIDEVTQNIDLCPTFAELAETPAPKSTNGRSLVPLLHGEAVSDWRNVAMVEHHYEDYNPADPDAENAVVKTPPTYDALRTVDSVYVEYITGEREYHDERTDPYEITNTVSSLSPAQIAKFHGALTAIKACQTTEECWAAQHLTP